MDLQFRWLGIYVKDWKKMTAFLRDTIGFKLQSEDTDSTLFVTPNGMQIEIFDTTQQPNAEALTGQINSVLLGFSVENIESTVEELKKRGIVFTMDIQTRSWGKYVYFSDPEDNQWQLFQYNR